MTYLQYLTILFSRFRYQAALIVGLVCLVYLPIFSNTFVWDDHDTILNWPAKESIRSIPRFIAGETPPAHPGNYRPLRNIFYILNHKMYGTHITGYHIQALAINIGCALFFLALVRRITHNPTLSMVAGSIFALHPAHVEAIVWVTSSMDMIGVLFLFGSLYYAYRSHENYNTHRRDWILSVILAGAAFFTNEVTLSLPFLLILALLFFRSHSNSLKQYVFFLLPYFIMLFLYGIMRLVIAGEGARSDYLFGSPKIQLYVMCLAVIEYLKVLIFPVTLTINHHLGHGITSWAVEFERSSTVTKAYVSSLTLKDPEIFLPLSFIIITVAFSWISRKRHPILSFSLFWMCASFIPMLNLIPTEAIMVERFLFLPSAGFALLIATLINHYFPLNPSSILLSAGKIGWTLAIIVIVLYSARAHTRIQDWKNNETLWRSTLAANPYASLSRLYLSEILLARNDVSGAIEQYSYALKYNPQYPGIRITLATLYDAIGQHDHAIQTLSDYESAGYLSAEDFIVLANSYRQQGKFEPSLQAYKNALKLSPNNPMILNNIGAVHATLKQYKEALKAFEAVLKIDPTSQSALQNLEKLRPLL